MNGNVNVEKPHSVKYLFCIAHQNHLSVSQLNGQTRTLYNQGMRKLKVSRYDKFLVIKNGLKLSEQLFEFASLTDSNIVPT